MNNAPVFSKKANDQAAVERLRREAMILQHVAHPNIVELSSSRFDRHSSTLEIAHVEGTLLQTSVIDLNKLADFFGALAATIAHLHQRGVAHMALLPEHVIVTPHGRPVLCGFGNAVVIGDENQYVSSEDVCAFGRLLQSCTRPSVDSVRIRMQEPEFYLQTERYEQESEIRRSLLDIAKLTQKPNPSERPTAAEVALLLRKTARSAPVKKPQRQRESQRKAPGSRILIPGAMIFVAVISFVVINRNSLATSAAPNASTSTTACPQRAGTLDIDDDGCVDDVAIADGVITINGERYAVGQPDDKIVLGHWYCKPQQTAALLRPSTGAVYVFNDWPVSGGNMTATRIGTVDGATNIAVDSLDGCDRIAVSETSGATTILDPKETQ